MQPSPKGNSANMWVFVTVFNLTQWTCFLVWLTVLVVFMTIVNSIQSGNKLTSRSSPMSRAGSSLTTALMFTLQMGDHPPPRARPVIRMLTLTLALLTLFMFIYYTTDITAQMTSGPPKVAIE